MRGLVEFANNGGKGLSLPTDIFAWNSTGSDGALHMVSPAFPGDAGYYPQWVNETRDYLGTPDPGTGRGTNNPDINVVMWAWCEQVPFEYQNDELHSQYLEPMSQLEEDYPGITFVYMTGVMVHELHLNSTRGNQVIRDYCIANNKVLFDIEDIECYDPLGTYYEFADDNCDYFESRLGPLLGNWAVEYQNSHTEGVDWFSCSAPHSHSVNANQKAYVAWWLWARLAGWQTPVKKTTWGGIKAMFE
jgi:hypothetical protein